MIQEIAPKVFHNEYTPRPAREEDIVFVFRGKEILVREMADGSLDFPLGGKFAGEELQYLFSVDDRAFFLGDREVEGFRFHSTQILRRCSPQDLCFAGMTAWHLYNWYETHQFCGKCGQKVRHHKTLRAMECSCCGNLMFPVIAPAVIVAVTNGDRILVTRYAGRSYKGLALIAGFCEIGETAEETVHREVMEEAGLRVKNLRYFGSQPVQKPHQYRRCHPSIRCGFSRGIDGRHRLPVCPAAQPDTGGIHYPAARKRTGILQADVRRKNGWKDLPALRTGSIKTREYSRVFLMG